LSHVEITLLHARTNLAAAG